MRHLVALCILVLLPHSAIADNEEFVGQWEIVVQIPAEPLVGRLDIESSAAGLVAFVDGGPAPLTIDGNSISITVDSRDRQGFKFERQLEGKLEHGGMRGVMRSIGVVETAAEFGEDGSSWIATRYVERPPGRAIRDVAEIAGIWAPLRGVDFRKWSMALTPAGLAWTENYDARMDEPQKRCVAPGLYSAVTWSFPFEIVADEGQVVMLYEAFNLFRRVFTDNRPEPDFFPNSAMGYATGRIDDGEFVIETKLLSQTVRDFNGEPVSENATISERYRLSEDGQRLSVILTLHDPDNYERPSVRRRVWTREENAVIYPFECDPDSFYRQLFNEGRMQEYIDRAPFRP